MKDKLHTFLQKDPETVSRALAIALCCFAALLVLAVACVSNVLRAEPSESSDPQGNVASGLVEVSQLPEGFLPESLASVLIPKQGKLIAISRTERVYALYYEDFPEQELQAYLQQTGLSFSETQPYVAETKDFLIAVAYDGGSLSVTVTGP